MDDGCLCHGCGRRYRVDVLVPDRVWDDIRPDKSRPREAGLLCGICIFARIEALGEFDAFNLAKTETAMLALGRLEGSA